MGRWRREGEQARSELTEEDGLKHLSMTRYLVGSAGVRRWEHATSCGPYCAGQKSKTRRLPHSCCQTGSQTSVEQPAHA